MIFARLELTRLGSAEGNGRNRGSITGRGCAGVIIVIQGLGESPKARGFCSPRQSWEVNRRWGVERDGYSGFLILSLPGNSDRCNTFDESWSVSMWRCMLRRLSEREKSETWDRFEGGESLRSISRRLGRPPTSWGRQR